MAIEPQQSNDAETDLRWLWFSMHSNQRMQILGYWLVAIGLVTAAYAQTLASGHRTPAAIIAFLGLIMSVLFLLLDRRTRQLVKIGEQFLSRDSASCISEIIRQSDTGHAITYTSTITALQIGTATVSLFLSLFAIFG